MAEVDDYATYRHPVAEELDALIELIVGEGATSYLEIGSEFGSSLWRVANALPKGSRIVSVDIAATDSLRQCIKRLNSIGYDAHLITGNSMEPATIRQACELGPYDAIFIDANHKLMYVRSDWEKYGPMGKLVAFHDIAWRRAIPIKAKGRIHVPEFWNSIKDDYYHEEIILDALGNAFGIGVLWRG